MDGHFSSSLPNLGSQRQWHLGVQLRSMGSSMTSSIPYFPKPQLTQMTKR